jgi:hypothetical protein
MNNYEDGRRFRYGRYKGHYKWDLAKSFFTMSNDSFFELYKFNFVPKALLFSEAKQFLADSERKANDEYNHLWRPAFRLKD